MLKNLFNFYFKRLNKNNIFLNHWDCENFNGNISNTLKWIPSDTIETYIKNGNKKYSENDITYEVNEYGYRTSKESNEVFKDNLVACFGCSNTFGIGLPLKETWPTILNQMLGDEWSVKNYGVIGASNDTISRLIYNYTLNNKPKIICCYFPEISRIEVVDDDQEFIINCMFGDLDHSYFKRFYNENELKKIKNTYDAHKIICNEKSCMFNFIKNFKFIETICKLYNIKFYWGTWSSLQYILPNELIKKHFNDKNLISYSLIRNDYARDNIHFGKETNKKIANNFFQKIII
jgi:hypothetical protein